MRAKVGANKVTVLVAIPSKNPYTQTHRSVPIFVYYSVISAECLQTEGTVRTVYQFNRNTTIILTSP